MRETTATGHVETDTSSQPCSRFLLSKCEPVMEGLKGFCWASLGVLQSRTVCSDFPLTLFAWHKCPGLTRAMYSQISHNHLPNYSAIVIN